MTYDADPLMRSVGDLSTHVAAAITEIRRLEDQVQGIREQAKHYAVRAEEAEGLLTEALREHAVYQQQRADDRLTIADLEQRLADSEAEAERLNLAIYDATRHP